jgi:hypothetical protein
MRFRVLTVALVVATFAVMQTVGGALTRTGQHSAFAASTIGQRAASVAQADGNENSDVGSGDNDNATATSDNDNDVAGDNGNDNGDTADNGNDNADSASASDQPAIGDELLGQPLTAASGTSTGADLLIATPGERVAVRVFPWLPAGIQLTIRPIDASSVPAVPGQHAGDLTFAVEAKDASGAALTTLPAEVNLAVRYADSTVDGLNESNLTISRLDPTTSQWQAAPKLVRETESNYVAASVTQLGTYTVSAQ